jgi:hypothetical protein
MDNSDSSMKQIKGAKRNADKDGISKIEDRTSRWILDKPYCETQIC